MDRVQDFLPLVAILSLITVVPILFRLRTRSVLFGSFKRGRRSSNSHTPPRSLSPNLKEPIPSPVPSQLPSEYKDILPPSTRENLTELLKKNGIKVIPSHVSEVEVRKNLIPFESDWRVCGPSSYTAMGVSLQEIRDLGDFPDYATLSGVPLPEEYRDFKLEQALARPYRPFRWAYHQTMCRLTYISIYNAN
jgi:hypothetical protein